MTFYSPKKYRFHYIFLFFSFLISTSIFSQTIDNDRSNFWSNVQFGGGLGLGFSDGFFSIAVAPTAIYRLNESVATGFGLNYSYSEERDVFKSSVVGASVLGLFNPIYEIQLSTEFQQLYVNREFDQNFVTNQDDEYWYPALFLGIGYSTNNVVFGIQYDVLFDSDRSIYSDAWFPFVRFFF
ncbi:MAG: alpha-ketoglutarate decarboxylase [Bacteroidota bacterium]